MEAPAVALWDVPLASGQVLRITALTPQGDVDKTFHSPLKIKGLRITQTGETVSPGDWNAGVLEIHTDLSAGRRVYVEQSELQFTADGQTVRKNVLLVWKWFSLLPPLVAIVLAIWLKDVIVALLAGVFAGAVVLAGGNPFLAFLRMIDTYLLQQLVPPDAGTDHIRAVMFTLMLGGMIGVMSASGGTRALVDRLTRYATTREHGQVLTWLLGLVVFFDDYANTLLVGSTMRSVSDRLRISREKLAFLVDSTSAPVAGLAVVSTWVGFELGQIGPALDQLGIQADAYSVFLATIPYRFYPMLLLIFVGAVAWSGRDFGSMRECEARIALDPHPSEVPAMHVDEDENSQPGPYAIVNAILPLSVLLGVLGAGITYELSIHPKNPDAYNVLLYSAFSALLSAGISAVVLKSLSLSGTVAAGIKGLQSMLLAVVILVLAWSIAGLCNDQHLNTAGFIIDGLHGNLSARWMPATAFVVSAAVSFATGSSFATMGLLMPLCISLTYYLMPGETAGIASHPFMLGTIGAVLAGSIFGDHCSPISDTTVLSSAAAGCDHLSHVATQMPYAMTVGLVSLGVGYLPIGWGVSPYISLPVAAVLLLGILKTLGRRPPEPAE